MTEDQMLTRREWIAAMGRTLAAGTALAAAGSLLPARAAAAPPRAITVYKDASCGCCKAWVTHLRGNGFAPRAHDRSDMDALKDSLGVPTALRSCHTAMAGRYVIEGHVPAKDIARLMSTAPRGITGLAVPGMPAGSPGMEMPGGRSDPYDVIAFHANGKTSVFASHR
ncbi:MAG: hypothetical protein JWL60_405 [Gemmatimonadetes bacterium]|jgi:hypothetical protein|nr:hypothetical protein [Gemmatimonadota bacterium]